MKNLFGFLSRTKLTQDLAGFFYFENFLVATVVTILGVRFFLKISGYPQIGGGGLHIAHMLWGGLLLLVCLLGMLLFMDRRIKAAAAVIGGVGFGLFIDELGKFITSDNDYFFQPTVAFLYSLFVALFLVLHLMKSKMKISTEEYTSNALDILRNSLVHGISEIEKEQLVSFLREGKARFEASDFYKLVGTEEFSRREAFTFLQTTRERTIEVVNDLVGKRIFQIAVIGLVEVQAFLSFIVVFFVVLYFSGLIPSNLEESIVLDLDFVSVMAIASSFAAGVLALIGAIYFRRSRMKAFTYIKYSLFISIFIVQFFVFWVDQFGALTGLIFNILALETVNVILAKYQMPEKG